MNMNSHVLVVGGTGMLADVSVWLGQHADMVSVIGRQENRHNKLNARMKNVNSLIFDYKDGNELRKQMMKAIEQYGPITLVVSWIHSHASYTLTIIDEEVSKAAPLWRLFHIQGSSNSRELYFPIGANCLYRSIILGYLIEGGQARWLTHKEICEGVIESIKQDSEKAVVGIVEPWDKRP
ncbi:short-chain dehydrogenase [Bacillus sp. PAMC26568]|nr:short-chain dehydrogenase [Bacillus sp. PAMC26568]